MRYTIPVTIFLCVTASLQAQHSLYVWGANGLGQLGDGIFDTDLGTVGQDKSVPTPNTCFDDWKAIFCDNALTFAIRQDGSLWVWGFGHASGIPLAERVFYSGSTSAQFTAKQVGTDTNWQAVSSSGSNTLAIKTDGTLWSWGLNSSGALGLGHTNVVFTPQQVGTQSDWAQVAMRGITATALKTDGTLWTWGQGDTGLLGDGTTVDRHTPAQMGTDTDWKTLAVGGSLSNAAIKWDRTLWAWGDAQILGLGLPGGTIISLPTRIGTDHDWKALNLSLDFYIALKMDGSLWSWGKNDKGQLGDGTLTNRTTPQRIGTDTDWMTMSVGSGYVVALKNNGSLWAWGGVGTPIFGYGNTPIRLGTDNNWTAIDSGSSVVVALRQEAFDPIPTPLSIGTDVATCAASADITASISGADLYKWHTPAGFVEGSETFNATASGTYSLTIVKNGCTSTDEINISVNNPVNTQFSSGGTPIDACPGYFDTASPVNFTPDLSTGVPVSWAFGNGVTSTEPAPQYTYAHPGHYEVTYTSSCGSSTTHTVDVAARLSLSNSVSTDVPPGGITSCDPVTLTANVADADTYQWQTPTGAGPTTPSIQTTTTGTYIITVTEGTCTQSSQVLVNMDASTTLRPDFSVLTAGITLDNASNVLREAPLTFVASGLETAQSYTWSLGDGTTESRRSFEHAYATTGDITIILKATDDKGCESSAEKQFHIRDLVINDAISANADGKNDKLHFDPLPYTSDLKVTDQNGRTVFTASPYNDDFTGNSLPSGVYYYELRFKEIGKSYKGFVHVVK